jgi:phospholipid/cholesterol/gamma-HCH transport system ATP-binding protein
MGDNIVFIYKGEKWWEGEKSQIKKSGNQELIRFMEASAF